MARRTIGVSPPARTLTDVIASPWFYLFFAVAVGIVVAQVVTGQIAPRWVKAIVGFFFLTALIRLPVYAVVCLFFVAYPFPTFIYLGNSNVFFILFMLGVWGIKVRMGKEPAPPRAYLDWAAWTYLFAQLVSFLNVDNAFDLKMGIAQTVFLGFAVGVYFLSSKVFRTESQLRAALHALAVTSLLVSITGLSEFFFPNLVLVPDWYIDAGPVGRRFAEGGRLGGIFGSQALLADFCSMMFILQLYLFIRAKSRGARLFYLFLMAAAVFQLVMTSNRGGFVIWMLGLLYLLWIVRSSLRARQVVIALPFIAAVGLVTELMNPRYLRMVTLIQRLETTKFEHGIVPDTRVMVWQKVLAEIPQHIWIGHGPFYNLLGAGGERERFWPHNAYLWYLWTTGVLGLVIFLWIMGKAIYKSFPGTKLKIREIPFAHGALVILHIQILQFAVSQLRDDHQRGNMNPFLLWGIIGLSISARRILIEMKTKPEGT